jgi:hypothetical protein
MEPLVEAQTTSYEICSELSGTRAGLSLNFFSFPTLIIISSSLNTHLSPPPEVYDSPEQAAQYHGFISDPPLAWLQSHSVKYTY